MPSDTQRTKRPIRQDIILWSTVEYTRGATTIIDKNIAITKIADMLSHIPDNFKREQYIGEIVKRHKDVIKSVRLLREITNQKIKEAKEKKHREKFRKETTTGDPEDKLGEKDEQYTNRAYKQWLHAEKFITRKYDIRNNTIKNAIELREKDTTGPWREFDENTMLRLFVYNKIPLSLSRIISLVKSDFVKEFNPIKEYFQNVAAQFPSSQNNGHQPEDFIGKIASYVKCNDQERWVYHFRKHMVRTVACALNPDYYNKHVPILFGGQHIGKSGFWNLLVPEALMEYSTTNLPADKDGMAALCENIYVMLEEMAVFSRFEINHLKAIVALPSVKYRPPFERRAKKYPRVCTFVGSTNRRELLQDETGNVRWLIFEVINIDWENFTRDYNFSEKNQHSEELKCLINGAYAQAYELYRAGTFFYMLDVKDIADNETVNQEYQATSTERDLIVKYFSPGRKGESTSTFKTATEIMLFIQEKHPSVKINNVLLGRILGTLGYEKMSGSKGVDKRDEEGNIIQRQKTVRGYYVMEMGADEWETEGHSPTISTEPPPPDDELPF